MSDIEKRAMSGTVRLGNTEYRFQAVVFRRVHYGAFGRIGETPWQFGNHSDLRTDPPANDDQRAQLEELIASQANTPGY